MWPPLTSNFRRIPRGAQDREWRQKAGPSLRQGLAFAPHISLLLAGSHLQKRWLPSVGSSSPEGQLGTISSQPCEQVGEEGTGAEAIGWGAHSIHSNPTPAYRGGNRGPEKRSGLLKITLPGSGFRALLSTCPILFHHRSSKPQGVPCGICFSFLLCRAKYCWALGHNARCVSL